MMSTTHRPMDSLPLQRVVLESGLEFHHVEDGEGPPLVFLHGVLGDWRTWAPQWPAFVPHFRCISYSRRYNVPNRNRPQGTQHSALVEADDLAALLEHWQAAPAILVGSSYGAFTALALAVSRPELVRALILLEPPMLRWADLSESGRLTRQRFETEVREPARQAFLAGDIKRGVLLLTGGIVGTEVMATLSEEALQRRLENELSIRMLTLSDDEFPWLAPETLQALKLPTLLLAGENTPPIHDHVFRNLSRVMTQARVARIPAAGHGAARDNPERFNQVALDFLRDEGLLP